MDFHKTALVDMAWKLEGVGEGDERTLLERFYSVTAVFQSLPVGSQEVRAYVFAKKLAGAFFLCWKCMFKGMACMKLGARISIVWLASHCSRR